MTIKTAVASAALVGVLALGVAACGGSTPQTVKLTPTQSVCKGQGVTCTGPGFVCSDGAVCTGSSPATAGINAFNATPLLVGVAKMGYGLGARTAYLRAVGSGYQIDLPPSSPGPFNLDTYDVVGGQLIDSGTTTIEPASFRIDNTWTMYTLASNGTLGLR